MSRPPLKRGDAVRGSQGERGVVLDAAIGVDGSGHPREAVWVDWFPELADEPAPAPAVVRVDAVLAYLATLVQLLEAKGEGTAGGYADGVADGIEVIERGMVEIRKAARSVHG